MSSPLNNLNKGYAQQEKSDLMNDNPIARDASSGRPMILKHMGGSKGSPLMELKGGQEELDKNKNGVIDGQDFKLMKK
jgi:hypothetical protein